MSSIDAYIVLFDDVSISLAFASCMFMFVMVASRANLNEGAMKYMFKFLNHDDRYC